MLARYFLIAGRTEAWLCSRLDPIERVARFLNPTVAKKLREQLPSRPGAPWAYMESCEIDCDIHEDVVAEVRELVIVRGTAKHRII